MTWLNVLLALLKIAGSLTDYLQQRRIIEGAQAELLKKQLEAASEIVTTTNKARADAAARFDAAGGVPDESDPNLRD